MAIITTSPEGPTPRFHILRCSHDDAVALARMLARGPIPREQPGDPACAYLALPIVKPWGYEEKFYEDAQSEAWLLALRPTKSTSLHAHGRKVTILVCVGGDGWLETGDGGRIPLLPETVVLIMPGARHRSVTSNGMWLVEFESPKDKFDLVRYEDDTRRAGTGYEDDTHAGATSGMDVEPLVALPAGPPLARLRDADSQHRFEFDLESGARVRARPSGLCAAISLELGSILRQEFAVVTAEDVGRAADDGAHLTIRRAA